MVLHDPGMCKAGWSKHEEFCYFFNQTGDTWSNSKVGQLRGIFIKFHRLLIYNKFVKNRL